MLLHKVYHRFPHHLPAPLSLVVTKLSPPVRPLPLRRLHSRRPLRASRMTAGGAFSGARRIAAFAPSSAEDGASGDANGAVHAPPSPDGEEQGDSAAPGIGYRLPPKEIKDIVDAPPLPALSFSPQRDKILFLQRRSLPPLEELAKPEEKLAGLRIDGSCNCRSRMSFYTGIAIHHLRDDGTLGPEKEVHGFPEGAKINFVSCYVWVDDSTLLVCTIPISRGDPKKPLVPPGPKIQSNEQQNIIQVE